MGLKRVEDADVVIPRDPLGIKVNSENNRPPAYEPSRPFSMLASTASVEDYYQAQPHR